MKLRADKMYQLSQAAGMTQSMLQVTNRGGGSYPTVHRLATGTPANQNRVDLDALERFLIAGLKMDPSELAEMKIGDLFEFDLKPEPS